MSTDLWGGVELKLEYAAFYFGEMHRAFERLRHDPTMATMDEIWHAALSESDRTKFS